jgi:hypothetical protein
MAGLVIEGAYSKIAPGRVLPEIKGHVVLNVETAKMPQLNDSSQ